MSSQDVVKAVSKKLRYYFDIKRREDGFDLSGPDCPRLDHPPLKARPTLMYDGLHDRPVKHYFHPPEVKVSLTKFNMAKGKEGREKQVKKKVERYMRQYSFIEQPSLPRESVSLPDSFYITNKKGRKLHPDHPAQRTPHRKSKCPHRGGYPVLRSLPPEHLSRGEASRLVNIATKLLVATETVDLKDQKNGKKQKEPSAPKSFESSSLPRLTDEYEDEAEDDSAYHSPLDSSSPSGGMYVTINGEPADNKQVPPWLRKEMQKTNLPDDDRGVDNQWVRPEPPDESARPKTSLGMRPKSSTQRGPRNLQKRDSVSSASSYSSEKSQSEDGKQDSTGVQTGGELLKDYEPMNDVLSEGVNVQYKVHVVTGKGLGSSTKADVRLVLYGDKGRTEELWLDDSKNHKVKFQRGQEDVFELDTYHVGEVRKMAIGHDRKELGYGWNVESVHVKDPVGKKQYMFKCERWLSSRAADSKTYCHFPVDTAMGYKGGKGGSTDRSRSSSFDHDQENIKYEAAESGDEEKSVAGRSDSLGSSRTSMATNYSERDKIPASKQKSLSRSSSYSSVASSSSYTTTSSSSSSEDDESEQSTPIPTSKEVKIVKQVKINNVKISDSQATVPLKKKDDFFDQKPAVNDYSSVVDTLSQSTEQDNRDDFDEDKQISSRNPRGKQLELRPVEETSSSESEDDDLSSVSSRGSHGNKVRGKVEGKSGSETSSTGEKEYEDDDFIQGSTIHQAAKSGDLNRVKSLMDHKQALKESLDERGWSPLHIACHHGHIDIVKWLAANKVNLEADTPTGYTPMHMSALNGHTNCMMVLSAMGAKITPWSVEYQTPLHLAAMSGHLESVKWLVANGAGLDVADHLGREPVDLAQEYKHTEVYEFLKASKSGAKSPASSSTQLKKNSEETFTKYGHESSNGDTGDDEGVGSSRGDDGWSHESRPKTSRSRDDQKDTKNASKDKHDEELLEKRRMYDKQLERRASSGNSFLDNIREEYGEAD